MMAFWGGFMPQDGASDGDNATSCGWAVAYACSLADAPHGIHIVWPAHSWLPGDNSDAETHLKHHL